ncbi:hypothetical protein CRUP_037519, partial [Coryphaenoides rupestris]
VLQCTPPAGLPPPVIFWMDNNPQAEQRAPGFMVPLGGSSNHTVLRGEVLELECIG